MGGPKLSATPQRPVARVYVAVEPIEARARYPLNYHVDDRRLTTSKRAFERRSNLAGFPNQLAVTTKRFAHVFKVSKLEIGCV